MEISEVFGRRLRFMRRAKNVTQVDLAKKLDVSQATISNIEHGTSKPTEEFAVSAAKALGISVEELVE